MSSHIFVSFSEAQAAKSFPRNRQNASGYRAQAKTTSGSIERLRNSPIQILQQSLYFIVHFNWAQSMSCQNCGSADTRRTAWLSRGLEALVHKNRWIGDPSLARPKGCGHRHCRKRIRGAIAADAFSGCRKSEHMRPWRGKEWLSGSFPSRTADLGGARR